MPVAGFIQQFKFRVMKIKMPQGVDMGRLVASDLPLLSSQRRPALPGGRIRGEAFFCPAVFSHAAQNAFVAGNFRHLRLLLGCGKQVVVMQLNAPARIDFILGFDDCLECLAYCPALTGIGPKFLPQGGNGISRILRLIIPAFNS